MEHAGDDWGSQTRGCLSVNTNTRGRVSIDHSTFRDCKQAGVTAVETEQAFKSFTYNTFEDCEHGLWLHAETVGSLGESLTYSGVTRNKLQGGTVLSNATWRTQGIPWEVDGSIEVEGEEDPILTLDAGVELAFQQTEWFLVGRNLGGSLIAEGSAEAPIVMRSRESQPVPGSWIGLVFGDGTLSGSALRYVTLENAGEDWSSGTRGCLTLDDVRSGRVRVEDSRFVSCAQAGVASTDEAGTFAAFNRNVLEDCEYGLWLDANVVGSVGGAQIYAGTDYNILEGGEVTETATWAAQPVPWKVRDSIKVQGEDGPMLTVEAGTVLQFKANESFEAGLSDMGGIQLLGTAEAPVILESQEPFATSGSWIGLRLS